MALYYHAESDIAALSKCVIIMRSFRGLYYKGNKCTRVAFLLKRVQETNCGLFRTIESRNGRQRKQTERAVTWGKKNSKAQRH